jgi:hypothetical protein
VRLRSPPEVRGAAAVARVYPGRAQAAQLALIDGAVGAAWAPGGTPRVVFAFTVVDGRVTGIEIVSDPERVGSLDVAVLDG